MFSGDDPDKDVPRVRVLEGQALPPGDLVRGRISRHVYRHHHHRRCRPLRPVQDLQVQR